MIVAGVDLGVRKAAVAILDGPNLVSVAAYESIDRPRSTQLAQVAKFVWQECMEAGVDVLYVEEPLVGRGVRTSLQIAQVAGAVLSATHELGCEFGSVTDSYLVSNTHWKKALIGVGAGKDIKTKVREWLDSEFPSYASKCDGDQDCYDATCIAIYGQRQQLLATRLREDPELLGAPAIPAGEALS